MLIPIPILPHRFSQLVLIVKPLSTHQTIVHRRNWLFWVNPQRCSSYMRNNNLKIQGTLEFSRHQARIDKTITKSTTWTSQLSPKTMSSYTKIVDWPSKTWIFKRQSTDQWLKQKDLFSKQWWISIFTSRKCSNISQNWMHQLALWTWIALRTKRNCQQLSSNQKIFLLILENMRNEYWSSWRRKNNSIRMIMSQ